MIHFAVWMAILVFTRFYVVGYRNFEKSVTITGVVYGVIASSGWIDAFILTVLLLATYPFIGKLAHSFKFNENSKLIFEKSEVNKHELVLFIMITVAYTVYCFVIKNQIYAPVSQ